MDENSRRRPTLLTAVTRLLLTGCVVVFIGALSVRYSPADVSLSPSMNALDFQPAGKEKLTGFRPQSTGVLERTLNAVWEKFANLPVVPNVAPLHLPVGLQELRTPLKKRLFIRSVLPHVLYVNKEIRGEREALLNMYEKLQKSRAPSHFELMLLERLADRYKIAEDTREYLPDHPGPIIEELLKRVDELPVSLVLAQAAIESGWGSSRFVLEGNNLFGQWVFSRSGGIAPKERAADASYSVARYENLTDSVKAYARNLNTLWAYEDLRTLRAEMRTRGEPLDAKALAQGLLQYSTRRQAYVEEIRTLIRTNDLKRFDRARLSSVDVDALRPVREAYENPPNGSDA